MSLQTLIVVLLVSACSSYAAWQLMPQAARQVLAKVLLRAPWPARVGVWLQKVAQARAGCGCSGCDQPPQTPAAQKLVFYPTRRR